MLVVWLCLFGLELNFRFGCVDCLIAVIVVLVCGLVIRVVFVFDCCVFVIVGVAIERLGLSELLVCWAGWFVI